MLLKQQLVLLQCRFLLPVLDLTFHISAKGSRNKWLFYFEGRQEVPLDCDCVQLYGLPQHLTLDTHARYCLEMGHNSIIWPTLVSLQGVGSWSYSHVRMLSAPAAPL